MSPFYRFIPGGSVLLAALYISVCPVKGQTADTINRTDSKGQKQGWWIKKYPNGNKQYEGYFVNDRPSGTLKRYYETGPLQSVLAYSPDASVADAIFYHPSGFVASKGRYVNQKKEGKWQFFSATAEGYLICEEEYLDNMKHGLAVKFYPGNKPSEKLTYIKDVRSGDWIQYHPNGKVFMSAIYIDGKLQGKYTIYFDDGKPQFAGHYKDDARHGEWIRYNRDGSIKSKINYIAGMATNPELYRRETAFLDSLERIKGKIADPEKTGKLW